MTNTLGHIIDASKTKIYYYIFFKIFFNKFILMSKVGKILFLDLKYRKEDLHF